MRPLVFSDTITVRTDAELRAAIDAAAAREDISASEWVRSALASITGTISAEPQAILARPARVSTSSQGGV